MITEIFGFLIIIGAIIFLLVRHRLGKTDKVLADERAIMDSPQQLRRELKQSTDEIINRMGRHIDRLELLVQQADNRAEELEEQLKEARTVISELEAGRAASVKARQVTARGYESEPQVEDFSAILKKVSESKVDIKTETKMEMPAPEVMMGIGTHEIQTSQDNKEPAPTADGMEADIVEKGQAEATGVVEEIQQGSSDAMQRARELLSMGYSTSQISKETHIGRGAIELMRQMYKKSQKN